MVLYEECDLINPNMTECELCYRYEICKKAKDNDNKEVNLN